jgi:hypothetical protein
MTRLSFQELCTQVALITVCISALAGLSVLKGCVCGKETLVVRGSTLGFFAACGIERRSVGGRHDVAVFL